ncbi:MAG TPA: ATP-dependent DNA ligase [Nitrospiraceae bacterium]|nr:ATP-dependent DNA ligase [Nitrospiraceae bacterium]
MLLADLVQIVEAVRAVSKKTEKIALLSDCLSRTRERETELAALYLSGLLPQGRIGIGWRLIEDAMVPGERIGDALSLRELDERIDAIAVDQGPGSIERRTGALRQLFQRVSLPERRFLSALLVGEVRQGALEGLVVEAIAKAARLPAQQVRQAFMFAEHIGSLARRALEEGTAGLARYSLELFKPVSPMLANSAEDVAEAASRLGESAWEYKLDGARIQLHKGDGEVKIFTRQLQDVTNRLPEVVELARSFPSREMILEGEAIALRSDGRPHPFQVTMRRLGRKKDVALLQQDTPLSSFYFDCLYLSDEGSLLSVPYRERMTALSAVVPPVHRIPSIVTADPAQAERFLVRALDAGHEGLMAKSLKAPYTAGQRGANWLKLKAAVTLDLVILAVEWGHGRRAGFLSNLHLGARDVESGQFVMLGKTFKGLTDDMLAWQTEQLLKLETHRDEWTVYVRPELVVEIAFSGVQESPRYPAGMALRFARVKRYRPDKSPLEADTLQTVKAHFDQSRL